jgi:hypothetical protein
MSGGCFNYQQYKINEIADEVESFISRITYASEEYYSAFGDETLVEFKTALEHLNKAAIYAQRIDWLVSGDDSEESFHLRLKEDLEDIK